MSVFRPFLEILFPATLRRGAGRVGTVAIVLAVLVAAFFPTQARAGTEVAAARWITAGALLLAGLGLSGSRGRVTVVAASFAVLVVAAFVAPAAWLLAFAGGGLLYAAMPLVRGGGGRRPHAAEQDPPMGEVPEIVEAVGMALVLALVVREFGFEAFKIPTGSMEPTILGDRLGRGSGDGRDGDRLLAFKAGPMRRWDIVVFRYPLFRGTNFIKRLVGLPGEHLEIRRGDIYVNGAIAPKPDDLQSILWRRALAISADKDWKDDFEADDASGWTYGKGYASVDAPAGSGGDDPGGGIRWTQVGGSFEEDLRATVDVEVTRPGGELLVSLEGGRRRAILRIAADRSEVSAPGVPAWDPGIGGFDRLGTKFRLGLSMADRIVRIDVDGRQVASLRHEDVPNDGLDEGRVRFGARGTALTLRRLVVENDVQYSESGTSSWDIPEGCYVMLGDNTNQSRDSRYWSANVVVATDGTEYVAPDMARLDDDHEERVFFPTGDGGVKFVDSYGIRHELTKDQVKEIRHNVKLPYVREEDLVGRAFFIFYPWKPDEVWGFRPRLLR